MYPHTSHFQAVGLVIVALPGGNLFDVRLQASLPQANRKHRHNIPGADTHVKVKSQSRPRRHRACRSVSCRFDWRWTERQRRQPAKGPQRHGQEVGTESPRRRCSGTGGVRKARDSPPSTAHIAPLLFDASLAPTPPYFAVRDALERGRPLLTAESLVLRDPHGSARVCPDTNVRSKLVPRALVDPRGLLRNTGRSPSIAGPYCRQPSG